MRTLVIGACCLLLVVSGVGGQTAKQKAEIEDNIKTLKTAKDAKARAAAATALGDLALVKVSLARPGEPILVDALKDPDPGVRRAAVLALTNLEPFTGERIPGLLPLLKEGEDRDARLAAITMLSLTQGGAKDAVPLLEDIIKKENAKEDAQLRDGELIDRSAEALVQIRGRLVGGYIKSLKEAKDAKVRAASAAELAKLAQLKAEQAKPAVPVLLEALRDDDALVRKAALTALSFAKPDPQEGVPALIGLLRKSKDDRGARLTIVTMLTAYGPSAADALPYLEFLHGREVKADDKTQDKEMLDRLTKALAAIKGQQ